MWSPTTRTLSTEPGRTIARLLDEARSRTEFPAIVLYWRVELTDNLFPTVVSSSLEDASPGRYIADAGWADAAADGAPASTAGAPIGSPGREQHRLLAAVPVRAINARLGVVAAFGDGSPSQASLDELAGVADRFAAIADQVTLFCGVCIRRSIFELGVVGVQRTASGANLDELLTRIEDFARVALGAHAVAAAFPSDGRLHVLEVVRESASPHVNRREIVPPIDFERASPNELSMLFQNTVPILDALVVPLVPGHTRAGILALGWSEVKARGPDIAQIAATLAKHVAPASTIFRLREALSSHRATLMGAKRRLGVISRIGRELGASLDEASIFRTIVRLAVPELCDYCFIHWAEQPRSYRLIASSGTEASTWKTLRSHFAELVPSELDGDGIPAAFASRAAEVVWNASETPASSPAPDYQRVLLANGIRSRISIPLWHNDEPLALLTMAFRGSSLLQAELDLVEQFGKRAEAALVNARHYAREYRVSHMLQRALLPPIPKKLQDMPIWGSYSPADRDSDIGGDWYDVFPLPGGRFGVSVGDVAGHGIDATTVMNVARHALRVAALTDSSPGAVLSRVDSMLQMETEPPMVTAIFGVMHAGFRRFEYAIAGHPPPIVAHANGAVETLDCAGPPLGVTSEAQFSTSRLDLARDDALVLYSDGMIEVGRDLIEGESRLREAVRAAIGSNEPDPASAIQSRVFGGDNPKDDAVVLVIRCSPLDHVAVELSAIPQSCRAARVLLRKFLEDHGVVGQDAHDIVTAVGEAVTNAVEHAYWGAAHRAFSLRLDAENSHVTATVSDTGRWRDGTRQDRGRGLVLMHAMMDDVSVETTPTGTEVRLVKKTPQSA